MIIMVKMVPLSIGMAWLPFQKYVTFSRGRIRRVGEQKPKDKKGNPKPKIKSKTLEI